MKLVALAALSLPLLAAATPGSGIVRGVSYSVSGETTIISIEVSGGFDYVTGRLHQPERVFFDIPRSRPQIGSRATYSKDFDNALLRRVRVAETTTNVTRVVLDLLMPVGISVSKLSNPARLRIVLSPAAAEKEKTSGADLSSSESEGSDRAILHGERPVTQALASEVRAAPPAAASKSVLTLSISPGAVEQGGAAAIVVAFNSSIDLEPVALQWQFSYPSPQIGIDPGQIAADDAAKSAEKTVTCGGKPEGPGTYSYTCIAAGGIKKIHSGAIARIPLRVRETARTGAITIPLTAAVSVDAAGRPAHLANSTATLEIR